MELFHGKYFFLTDWQWKNLLWMKNPSNPDEIILLENPTLRIGKPWNIRRKPWLYSLPLGGLVVQIFPYQPSSRIMPKTLQKWWNHNSYDCITWQSVVSDFTSSYDFDVINFYLIPSWKPIIMGGHASINSYFRVPTNNQNHIGVFFIYPLVNIQKTMENRHFWIDILQLFRLGHWNQFANSSSKKTSHEPPHFCWFNPHYLLVN